MSSQSERPDRPEVSLQAWATGSAQVYQATGDQYIYNAPPTAPAAVNNTLPRDTFVFEGRDHEVRKLVDAVRRRTAAGERLPIYAIDGMPGVGKTSFAVHAAHLLADRFPDGTLFVNLHAHTAGQLPVDPADALGSLLSITGVAAPHIPVGVDARGSMWRGRLAGKRILLVLDNAAGHHQVKPLLPSAGSSLILVTSRRRLGTPSDAVSLSLGALSSGQAIALLGTLSGRDLSGSEAAAGTIVGLCGHLPLAISMVAGRLRGHPSWLLQDLIEDLADAETRLDELQAEDVAVAAMFELSYRGLTENQKTFFRGLGSHPGEDIDDWTAAALAGVSRTQARHHLVALHDNHLIEEPHRRRYRMHDLIRDYTRALAAQDGQAAGAEAIGRLFDYYQRTAALADQHLDQGLRTNIPTNSGGSGSPSLTTRAEALHWMETERANLLACAEHTIRRRQHPQLLRFAETMAGFLRQAGPWDRAIEIHRAATAAAEHDADPLEQARALVRLAIVQYLSGNYPHAREAVERALALFRDVDDPQGQAAALCHLGIVHELTNEYEPAVQALEESLVLFRRLDDRQGQADAIIHLGIVRYLRSDYPGGIDLLEQALALYRAERDLPGQANASYHLGLVWWLIDDYPRAAEALEKSLALRRECGNRLAAAEAQNWLGAVWCAVGKYEAAARAQSDALTVFREMGSAFNETEALYNLGITFLATEKYESAVDFLEKSLDGCHGLGNPLGEADSLLALGSVHRHTGDHARAVEALDRSLTFYRDLDNRLGEAAALNELGALLVTSGGHAEALEHHELALRLARSVGSPLEEALALAGIGRHAHREHRTGVAIAHFQDALAILHRIGAGEARKLEEELAALEQAGQDQSGP